MRAGAVRLWEPGVVLEYRYQPRKCLLQSFASVPATRTRRQYTGRDTRHQGGRSHVHSDQVSKFVDQRSNPKRSPMRGKHGLDPIDIRILSSVQKHGQLSKSKLAELVNLSPTPCWARLNKLKSAGLIRGYRGDIALDRIANFTQVIVTVALTYHRKSDFDRFEAHIRQLDEVTECIATGGGMDYVMKVFSPSLAAFQSLMESLLAAELGIERYMTYIVTREVKSQLPNLKKLAIKTDS